ncbi:hypothetical protein [Spiroplasma sp. DGKH1]|uniref:hypothetical protein n=1 Tax=Spiroplasma sp. DGKH1 TaxID=3050074 RepID=UPI0034C61AA7
MNPTSTDLLINKINHIFEKNIPALDLPEIVNLNELLEISKYKRQPFEVYWVWEKMFTKIESMLTIYQQLQINLEQLLFSESTNFIFKFSKYQGSIIPTITIHPHKVKLEIREVESETSAVNTSQDDSSATNRKPEPKYLEILSVLNKLSFEKILERYVIIEDDEMISFAELKSNPQLFEFYAKFYLHKIKTEVNQLNVLLKFHDRILIIDIAQHYFKFLNSFKIRTKEMVDFSEQFKIMGYQEWGYIKKQKLSAFFKNFKEKILSDRKFKKKERKMADVIFSDTGEFETFLWNVLNAQSRLLRFIVANNHYQVFNQKLIDNYLNIIHKIQEKWKQEIDEGELIVTQVKKIKKREQLLLRKKINVEKRLKIGMISRLDSYECSSMNADENEKTL